MDMNMTISHRPEKIAGTGVTRSAVPAAPRAVPPGVERVPSVPGVEGAFKSVLAERLKSFETSPNRYAVPEASSVKELTELLGRQVNEHMLSVIKAAWQGTPPSGRSFAFSHAAWLGAMHSCEKGKNVQGEGEKNAAGDKISRTISLASRKFGVNEDLVRAVIRAESGFRPDAVSHKGAVGLMQLMPDTAREMGVGDPYNPVENILGGVRYLKKLLNRYDGDVDRALAAYNWGMGNLERSAGNLPEETRLYLVTVKRFYGEYRESGVG